MSTDTKKRTEKKRTQPWSKTHRKISDMFLNEMAEQMLVEMAVDKHVNAVIAEEEAHDFFMDKFVFGIINPANERLNEEIESFNLHEPENGDYKVRVERMNKRGFKDFVIEAKALLQEVIDEHIDEKETDLPIGLIKLLKDMLFGDGKTATFKFSKALNRFMEMEPDELGNDERLLKAQQIVIKGFKVEKSRWYRKVYKYDDREKRYVPIRPQYQVPEPEETE